VPSFISVQTSEHRFVGPIAHELDLSRFLDLNWTLSGLSSALEKGDITLFLAGASAKKSNVPFIRPEKE